MTKEKIKDRLWVFVNRMYEEAGIPVPFDFDPETEAKRIAHALIAKGMGIEP